MKAKSIALYVSLAANVALLVLAVWPKTECNIAFGQAFSATGKYSMVASGGYGDQGAVWIANKFTGQLAAFQYQAGNPDEPIQAIGQRDLRSDLEEHQVGNLLLVGATIASTSPAVFVIDTDTDRMVVYSYTRGGEVEGIQKIDLGEYFSR